MPSNKQTNQNRHLLVFKNTTSCNSYWYLILIVTELQCLKQVHW